MSDLRTQGGTTINRPLSKQLGKGRFCFSALILAFEGADDMDDHHHLHELIKTIYYLKSIYFSRCLELFLEKLYSSCIRFN